MCSYVNLIENFGGCTYKTWDNALWLLLCQIILIFLSYFIKEIKLKRKEQKNNYKVFKNNLLLPIGKKYDKRRKVTPNNNNPNFIFKWNKKDKEVI